MRQQWRPAYDQAQLASNRPRLQLLPNGRGAQIDFEAWSAENGMAMHLARAESGLYVSRVTQNYMDCWMASQAKKAAEVEILRNTLAAIYNKIEGNTRLLARGLVNRASGLSNDVHPDELYGDKQGARRRSVPARLRDFPDRLFRRGGNLMGHQFKPSDLALIAGWPNAGICVELLSFHIAGYVRLGNGCGCEAHVPSWHITGRGLAARFEGVAGRHMVTHGLISEPYLTPLRGDIAPEQQKAKEAEPC